VVSCFAAPSFARRIGYDNVPSRRKSRYTESMLNKRSFSIAGHRTSIALEAEFWAVLDTEASRRGLALAALVAEVDANRGERALASALRVHALDRASVQANGG